MSNWKDHLNADPTEWLLTSNPWVRYSTMKHLLEVTPSSAEAMAAKKEMLEHPYVKHLISEAEHWLSKPIKRNNDPTISYFQLRMLADFGIETSDPGVELIAQRAKEHMIDGMFAVKGNTGELLARSKEPTASNLDVDDWHISPCNSPMITYALLSLGLRSNEMSNAINMLKNKWDTEQGWFCHFFFVESQFKKLNVGCPMAGIMALEVFSLVPELKESVYAQNAFAPILFHRDYGQSLYYFGRSKKFWTMKYPFVWYNALYLADVLTRFQFLKGNALVEELVRWVETSQDPEGHYKATSIYMPYKQWDFGDKKTPSGWITYLCCKILKQWYDE